MSFNFNSTFNNLFTFYVIIIFVYFLTSDKVICRQVLCYYHFYVSFNPLFYWLLDDTVLCYYHFDVPFDMYNLVLRYYHFYVSFNAFTCAHFFFYVLCYYHFYVSFNMIQSLYISYMLSCQCSTCNLELAFKFSS